MSTMHPTGLGEPEPVGKKSLFQPPDKGYEKDPKTPRLPYDGERESVHRRVRTTIGLTNQALSVIQEIQNHYRLETGKVLPLWKLVSEAIEYYGKARKGKGHETKLSD